MPRIKKTFFQMEVSDSEYHIRYNGTLREPVTNEERKHNERLMRALIANDDLLIFFYNIVMPVVRFKRREARKKKRNKTRESLENVSGSSRE